MVLVGLRYPMICFVAGEGGDSVVSAFDLS